MKKYHPPYKSKEIIIDGVVKYTEGGAGTGRGCVIYGKDLDQYFATELRLEHWRYDTVRLFSDSGTRILMDCFDFEEGEEIEIIVRRKKK